MRSRTARGAVASVEPRRCGAARERLDRARLQGDRGDRRERDLAVGVDACVDTRRRVAAQRHRWPARTVISPLTLTADVAERRVDAVAEQVVGGRAVGEVAHRGFGPACMTTVIIGEVVALGQAVELHGEGQRRPARHRVRDDVGLQRLGALAAHLVGVQVLDDLGAVHRQGRRLLAGVQRQRSALAGVGDSFSTF